MCPDTLQPYVRTYWLLYHSLLHASQVRAMAKLSVQKSKAEKQL